MVAGQPSQVTVSAKNLTMEGTFSKFEAENKDCIMGNLGSPVVAGPPTRQFIPGFRAGAQITGKYYKSLSVTSTIFYLRLYEL
jgi:hypothetical protein